MWWKARIDAEEDANVTPSIDPLLTRLANEGWAEWKKEPLPE